jgi:hypothetical protein
MESILLFNTYDLMSVLENQKAKISEVVSKMSKENLSEGSLAEIESTVLKDIQVDQIILTEDEITVDQIETKIDVSRDPMRAIFDRSRPFFIDGIKVIYYLPFTGDSELFKCRPNQFNFNPPRANRITKDELIFEFNAIDGKVSETRPAFERILSDLRLWIGWINNQVEQFNESIKEPIRLKINSRRQLIDESKKQINDLGFKVRPKIETSPESLPQRNNEKKQKRPLSGKKQSKEIATYDVALSFAGEDRKYVEEVAQILRDKGVNVFYDNFNKVDLWGRNLIDHLGKVYSESSRFIVMFISKHYAEKTWTNHERQFAQDRAFKMKEDCILPARFDKTEILGLPSSIGYIDLQKTTPKELADLIEEKIKIS